MRLIDTTNDVERTVRRIWDDPLIGPPAVLHPTAVWERDDGALITIEIGHQAPTSDHDTFALGIARARADAIVTTGAVLRAEPDLRHTLPGPSNVAGALAAWRRDALGKHTAPVSLVLTSGRDLDLAHPLFDKSDADGTGDGNSRRVVVLTDADGADLLDGALDAEVVAVAEPGIRAAVLWLRLQGYETISIEAGPSTSTELYVPNVAVDEVMLSVYEGADLDAESRGGKLPDIIRHLPLAARPWHVATATGGWRFERRLRAVGYGTF